MEYPPLALGLLAFALLLYWTLSVLNRRLALAVFCALLPTYLVRLALPLSGIGLTLPTTFLELMFLGLFAAWFLVDGRKKGAWRAVTRWAYPLTLIFLGATVGLFVSPDWRAAAGVWRAYFLEPILFFVMFVDVVRTRRERLLVLGGLGACLAVIGLSAVYQKIMGLGIPNPVWQAAATRRVTSFFGYPNAIGLFAAPVVVLLAGWTTALARPSGWRRLWALLPATVAVLGLLGCLFAVSKGSLIGAAVGLVLFGLLTKPLRAPTLGLIIAACLTISLWSPVTDYFSHITGLRDDSGSVRVIVWRESAAMLADHPIFGAGLAGYQSTFAPYRQAKYIEIFMYPHDIILNFWSEIGLIGLAGFIWLLVVFFRLTARLHRRQPDDWLPAALLAAMTAVLIHGLVDVPYFKNDLALLFWILIGLAESLALATKAIVKRPGE